MKLLQSPNKDSEAIYQRWFHSCIQMLAKRTWLVSNKTHLTKQLDGCDPATSNSKGSWHRGAARILNMFSVTY